VTIEIKGGNTRGETVEIGNHDGGDSIYGGAFLHKCIVEIRGSNFSIKDANFLDCRINVHEELKDIRFLEAVFERSVFTGSFVACRFGYRRGESETPNAYYRNCDFSDASLDRCDFFVGDIDSITWPRWPNLTILNPRRSLQDWRSIKFPEEFASLRELDLVNETPGCDNEPQAIVIDLKRFGEVDLEAIKSLVQSKAYVLFQSPD